MRYIVLHTTDARWEAGQTPSKELIASVGKLIGELVSQKAFVGGEGLRASSLGVRLRTSGGGPDLTKGPYGASPGVPNGFVVMKVASLEEATSYATRLGKVLGDVEIDVRPVTEPWDIGMAPRPTEPHPIRFMALYKDPAAPSGATLPARKATALAKLVAEMDHVGVLVTTVSLQPTATAVRCRGGRGEPVMTDGPFTESKELIAGYMMVDAPTREQAIEWLRRYAAVVESEEVDIREVLG